MPTSEGRAVGEFRRFQHRLAGMTQRPVQYARVVQSVMGEHWHVHALLAECGELSESQIRGAWKGGIVNEVERYDDTLRGAHYMCRDLDRFPDAIDLSRTLPEKLPAVWRRAAETALQVADDGPTRHLSVVTVTDLEPVALESWARSYARAVIARFRELEGEQAA